MFTLSLSSLSTYPPIYDAALVSFHKGRAPSSAELFHRIKFIFPSAAEDVVTSHSHRERRF